MTSPASRFRLVETIFQQALERDSLGREEFVREAAGDDAELAREVLELLQADATADGRLDAPPSLGVDAPPPARIGEFEIVGLLGEGGMGVVYEAVQPDPKRTVALKVVRPGFIAGDALARFRREAQTLAGLDHAGIATVYESGSAETGAGQQPWFAMELVRGKSITSHARDKGLTTSAKLELFAKVADAVQHAHERGIAHRDLKPGNILVTDDGRPKILDFGIARALDPDLRSVTLATQTGQLIGTVPYMAPEQIRADPNAIDHRVDIYALGVVLYELLAGRLPLDVKGRGVLEAVRVIGEQEPSSLSSINRSFRGDIDTIVAKALEKDPARRFQTAAEFAADLRRHLADEPIQARPASTYYQLSKFAKRHKAIVASVATVFVVLVVALVIVTASLASERQQKLLVQKQRDTLADVNTFLAIDFIGAVDPSLSGSREVTLLEAIDQAEEQIAERFADSPDVEGQVRYAIGSAYMNLNELEKAEPQLRRAVELARLGHGTKVDLADRLSTLGICRMDATDLEEAQELLAEAAELRRVHAPDDVFGRVTSLSNLGGVPYKLGNPEEAERILREAYELGAAEIPESDATLAALVSLALVTGDLHGPEAAEPLSRKALDMQIEFSGMDNLDTLTAANNHANLLGRLGRFDEAEPIYKEVLEIRLRILGEGHRHTHVTRSSYGRLLRSTGRLEEAEEYSLAAYEGFLDVLGPDHPYTMISIAQLAYLYTAWGRESQALEWLALLPEDNPAHTERLKLRPNAGSEPEGDEDDQSP